MAPRLLAASGLAAAMLVTGCSAVVDVRSLATGRVDVSAYELRGPELVSLQREARRLCPQGGEVLRQSGRDQRRVDDEGQLRRLMNASSEVFAPPQRQSQLVVRCKEAADTTWATGPAPAGDGAAPAPAVVPLVPIVVEW